MSEELIKLAISLLIGSLLGLEREYNNKPAGFRTIALICVGAAIFTILSISLGISTNTPDRIASNIITGIGFIGAGVIFKTGNNVVGLTTAATIWMAAALGMAVGVGNYPLAWSGLIVVLLVLTVFERIQNRVHIFHERRIYTLLVKGFDEKLSIEAEMSAQLLLFRQLKEKNSEEGLLFQYEVTGRQPNFFIFDQFLRQSTGIVSYEY